MHLWIIQLSGFAAALVFYLGSQNIVPTLIVGLAMVALFVIGFIAVLPASFQQPLKDWIWERKKVFILNAAWENEASEGHLKEAYRIAAKDGHLPELQRRMARRVESTMTVGEVWTALELSRVDAGLKPYPELRLFRKRNSFQA